MLRVFAFAGCLLAFGQAVTAADLSVGDAAPKFSAQDDTGETWESAAYVGKGKMLVVYFYPADMTGGCTKQACGFRDDMKKLQEAGVTVVGVSGDTVQNHQWFKKAEDLNFTLLADPDGKVAKAFGVPFDDKDQQIVRTVDGKDVVLARGGTAKRWTFLIGPDGKIALKNTKVQAAGDSQAILKKVQELQ